MTKPFQRPSLLQAREPISPFSESSASNSYARSHTHRHLHHAQSHKHTHGNAHGSTPEAEQDVNSDSSDDVSSVVAGSDALPNNDNSDSHSSSDSPSLDLREPAAVVEADFVARQEAADPLVTQVVQTVSLIQVVDHAGSPIATHTRYAPPATVVVNSNSGETVEISAAGVTAEAGIGGIGGILNSILPGGSASSLPASDTTTSTHFSRSTSLPDSTITTVPSASIFPTLSDTTNGTALPGNITVATGSSNGTVRPLLFAPSSQNLSTTQGNYRTFSSSTSYLSTTDLPTLTTASTTGGGAAGSTAAEGVAPTTEPDDGAQLTPQQKQVIGGVVGGIAGVAFVALLVLLILRHKRKKNAQSPSSVDQRGFTAIGDDSGGAAGSMAERTGAAAAVTAAFAGLAGKRQQRASEPAAPPPPGERGFYRVSGRKLPSVLHAGGDGYTDPRESAMSAQSQNSRESDMLEAFGPGSRPYALGTPMRPVSGVPIMRSGPARTPVTESNPFADPPPSPPPPPSPLCESPPRSVGSRGSPRASGSRFQESI
ncbi:hypothetical protein K4F52_001005 [Lecanicillium sp. MT-2017a]|nr:hypothetical protein K4F52_001005 [Lecanicillium sp. MT-2017a]